MKITICVLVVFAALVVASEDRRLKVHRRPHEVRFQQWMVMHNKKYTTQADYEMRLKNFIASTQRVTQLNARAKALNSTATFGINKFADLSEAEFSLRLGMKGYVSKQIEGVPVAAEAPQAPSSFDWRKNGGITAVKDQGQCGSCWAFSCTETIESVYMTKAGKKNQEPLAPQQIVDCDHNGAYGCNGGDLPTCYNYVIGAGGLETNKDYPYHARDGTCKAQKGLEQDPIKGFQYVVPSGSRNENQIANYVAANSPVAILVDANSWSFYRGGVLTAAECGNSIDHAVQIVGYDTTQGYWIVRNSWGADWGEQGFIRLQFGKNTCDMDYEVTVPTI